MTSVRNYKQVNEWNLRKGEKQNVETKHYKFLNIVEQWNNKQVRSTIFFDIKRLNEWHFDVLYICVVKR